MSTLKTILKSLNWIVRPSGLHHQIDELGTHVDQLGERLQTLENRLEDQLTEVTKATQELVRWQRSHAWVYGHQMRLDPDDTVVSPMLCNQGSFEDFETELVLQEIKPGEVVVDVGANIGYYTLLFARQVGPEGCVFAFEPDPHNFQILKQNVLQNGYRNVTCIPSAVADRTGSLQLFRNEGNRGDHRIYDSRDGRAAVDVISVSLDDYFRDTSQTVDFIKMDIQGAEARALRGMHGLLQRSSNVRLFSEFWPRGLMLCGDDGAKYLQDLRDLGFEIHVIDGENHKVVPADPVQLLERLPVEPDHDLGFTNLFCLRKT